MKTQIIDTTVTALPKDLNAAIELVYNRIGISFTNPKREAESAEYGALTFNLDKSAICYRIAKITATKTGQFVTLWKRKEKGPIQPFDIADPIDLFIISTRNEENFGQFIFTKSVLREKGVLSVGTKGGKRAIRVYPPWDKATSKQAAKTQSWQADYFLEISGEVFTDLERAKKLLNYNVGNSAEIQPSTQIR